MLHNSNSEILLEYKYNAGIAPCSDSPLAPFCYLSRNLVNMVLTTDLDMISRYFSSVRGRNHYYDKLPEKCANLNIILGIPLLAFYGTGAIIYYRSQRACHQFVLVKKHIV